MTNNNLLPELEQYWTKRAPSYSAETNREAAKGNDQAWIAAIEKQLPSDKLLKILDVGTGPGFLAIALAKQGHQVTAVDYTQAMLDQAMINAGSLAGKITFLRMDAQNLTLPGNTFDAVVSRDLTWNLENPGQAYREWFRVLKPGGVMLNFDAGWYSYLFDQHKQEAFRQDRKNVAKEGCLELNDYDEAARMEEIAKNLMLSRCKRPESDIRMLKETGFRQVYADEEIWKSVWDEVQQLNNASTPCFMLCGTK